MNFTIIPHFLAVTAFLNNSHWPLGPDYTFEVKKTTQIYRKPFTRVELNCKLQCQPRIPDSLICLMTNYSFQLFITHENSDKHISPPEVIEEPHLFEIKFNKRGVQNLLMKPSSYSSAVGIIRQIAEVFNVSTDLSNRTYGKPQLQKNFYLIDKFYDQEQTLRGNCKTEYMVSHDIDTIDTEGLKFHLTVLPLADLKINATIVINKVKQTCLYSERYLELLNEMNVTHYFSTMKIGKGFKSFIELVASLSSNPWNEGSRVFSEKIDLTLIKMKRALKTLPNVSEEAWLTLDKEL